jgi:hypothetical protein
MREQHPGYRFAHPGYACLQLTDLELKRTSTFRSFSGFVEVTHVDRSHPSSRSRIPERVVSPQRSPTHPPPIAGKGRRDHKPVTDPCGPCARSDIPAAHRTRGTHGALVVLSCIQLLSYLWGNIMQKILQFLPTVLALTGAVILASAAIAPSSVSAATHERSAAVAKTGHVTATRERHATYRRYRAPREVGAGPIGAYGAIPGGSVYSSPSYPGFGYGYGDNSHGCSACVD